MKPNTSRYLASFTSIVASVVIGNGLAYAQTSSGAPPKTSAATTNTATATLAAQTSTGTTTTVDTPEPVPAATHRIVRKNGRIVHAPVKPHEHPSKPQHAVARLR